MQNYPKLYLLGIYGMQYWLRRRETPSSLSYSYLSKSANYNSITAYYSTLK